MVRTGAIHADGTVLRYTREGSGRPLLVIGSSLYYPRTFSAALRSRCSLTCADLRHFATAGGEGRDARRPTLEDYTRDIDSLRAAAGFERVVIVGHSHHGNLALEYAKRYPQCVSHVVLIGTPPVGVQAVRAAAQAYWEQHASAARKAILRENQAALGAQDLEALTPTQAFIARYVADGPVYWFDPRYDAAWLWQGMRIDMHAVHALRGFFTDYTLSWNAASRTAPVLVVMGRHDYAVPHVLWQDVLPTLDNVSFRLLERSGHTPQLEEPAVFDRLLLAWLEATDAS